MDNDKIREMERQLLPIDLAKQKLSFLVGRGDKLEELFTAVLATPYAYIHPAWGVELYLSRN